jgi:guanylate kinase
MQLGLLYVISAPSGTGKTSLVRALATECKRCHISVSYTTRAMRPGEVAGQEYHFVSREAFEQLEREQAFLEHACVFGQYYGTHKNILAILQENRDVILEIDWQGQQQIKKVYPQCVSIFILPPNKEALQARLQQRRAGSSDNLEQRLAEAGSDCRYCYDYDFVLVNDNFDLALQQLRHIVEAGRLQVQRQQGYIQAVLRSFALSQHD